MNYNFNANPKDATKATNQANQHMRENLNFEDREDLDRKSVV